MKKMVSCVLAAVLMTGVLSACGEKPTQNTEVVVYAAKSMTDCLNDVIAQYEQSHEAVKISANYASSGDLQSQIEQGAPCDIFISAAQKQMDALEKEQLIQRDSRKDLLQNTAVLITPNGSNTVKNFADLASSSVKRVSIGDPASVPAGQYAQESLTALGLWDAVSQKAVLGADVRQVLAWVETGEVDAGIVYATDAAISDGVTVVCEAPADTCAPVVYPAALTASSDSEAARSFYAFLSGEEAMDIFVSYGFRTVD